MNAMEMYGRLEKLCKNGTTDLSREEFGHRLCCLYEPDVASLEEPPCHVRKKQIYYSKRKSMKYCICEQ